MRYLTIVLLIVFIPLFSVAQMDDTTAKKCAMNNFIKFYNHQQADSILKLFKDVQAAKESNFYPKKSLDSMFEKNKKIISYKYYSGMIYDYVGGSSSIDDFRIVFTAANFFLRVQFADKGDKFDFLQLRNKLPEQEEMK